MSIPITVFAAMDAIAAPPFVWCQYDSTSEAQRFHAITTCRSGASMTTVQQAMRDSNVLGTTRTAERLLTIRSGPGLRAAGHRQVVG